MTVGLLCKVEFRWCARFTWSRRHSASTLKELKRAVPRIAAGDSVSSAFSPSS